MLAYNHEPYIAQAIESIIFQETDLDFELIIGEDCSTDNTKEIIKKYVEKYPQKIKLVESELNVGMHENFLRTLFACDGEYICQCDGDDYWDNPLKLQIQYDFLESNKDYVLVCGNAKRFNDYNQTFEGEIPIYSVDRDVTFRKLIRYNCITTSGIMFRNVLERSDYTNDFYEIISVDWYNYMKLLKHGKFMYLNQIFSVYRVNEGSINGRTNQLVIQEKEMKFLQLVKTERIVDLDDNMKKQLEESIDYKYNDIAKVHASNGEKKQAIELWWYSFKKRSLSFQSLYQLTITSFLIINPGLFRFLKKMKNSA